MRMGGQLRAVPGSILGFDMSTALELGEALGVSRLAVAEFMPLIEAVAVKEMNAAARGAEQGFGNG